MEQFSLDKWIQDKSRKVVVETETGYEVKIISTEAPGDCPIVGYIYNGKIWLGPFCWNKKGISPTRNRHNIDLFFADDEEELTEFESKLADLLVYNHPMDIKSAEIIAKRKSKTLLDLARKELQPEFDKEMDNLLAETDKVVYQKGQQDALKDLPKWEKNKLPNSESYMGFTGSYFCYRGYNINYDKLFEKLPKEE